MEFIVIVIVAVVTANSAFDGSSTIQESKELKKIEQVVQPETKQEAAKQEVAKQEAAKQEAAQQEIARQEVVKQEKINQVTADSDSLIEKAVNYFSQYYLIGLILAAIAYIYFRTQKKVTLKEILVRKEFNEKQQKQIAEETKPEPSVEQPTTEEFKPDSQPSESSDEEEEKK